MRRNVPGVTSLVTNVESVHELCPRRPGVMVAADEPDLWFPATCRAWACIVCGPRKAKEKAAIVAWAKPERFLTFTLAPKDWQVLRKKVRVLKATLRAAGYDCEWAWTVEEGKKTGMRHVHALQHGSFIPQAELQDRWGAIVDIRKINAAAGAGKYALKEARRVAGYASKGAAAHLERHLALNGGRGIHISRGYLRGLTSPEVWKLLHPAVGRHDWIFVPRGKSTVDVL